MATILSSDFLPVDCLDLEQGGTTGVVYHINYDDWILATKTEDADKTITGIALTTSGAKAVKYTLTRGAPVPTSPFTKNAAGKSGWAHSVAFFMPTKDQSVKTEIANLANFGRVVTIVVLDSGVVANVYGYDMGLELTTYEEAPNDPSLGGGLQITLGTPPDVTLENLPPRTFLDTDRATTVAALETLLTAVP
jgi:hypothetical protein